MSEFVGFSPEEQREAEAANLKFESRSRYQAVLALPLGTQRLEALLAFVQHPATYPDHRRQAISVATTEVKQYPQLFEDTPVLVEATVRLLLSEVGTADANSQLCTETALERVREITGNLDGRGGRLSAVAETFSYDEAALVPLTEISEETAQ